MQAIKIIRMAMILFSESNNYRRSARILNKVFGVNISYQLIVYWVQKVVDQMPQNINENKVSRDIEIVEMDELYTFFKNEKIVSEFGLLWTETRCVCLHFGSALEIKSQQDAFLTKSRTIKYKSSQRMGTTRIIK